MDDDEQKRVGSAVASTSAAVDAASKASAGIAASARRPAKDMTKAERRALQVRPMSINYEEQQREAKAKEREKSTANAGKKVESSSNAVASPSSSGTAASRRGPRDPTAPTPSSARSAAGRPSAATGQSQVHDSASSSSSSVMNLFLHLDPPKSAKSLNKMRPDQIHPSILRLALQYAEFRIVGANARCLAMLRAFKDVIASYTTPVGTSLSRHLPRHLEPQITHLIRARPMAVSMGNAIRFLKWEISEIPLDLHDDQAKTLLCERIDHFIRDRIVLAGKVIEGYAIEKIKDGDTILTFARSSLVEAVLIAANASGKRFSVVVVDSRPLHEGKNLLRSLLAHGITCTYVLLSSIGSVLPTVSLTLLGTHALLSNGAMFSRAGTAMVAMMSKGAGVPVICCCETYKFSDRTMLDSIVGNERGSTANLLPGQPADRDVPNLGILNFLYDVSRPEDVTAVVTEAAIIPVQSVPFVLKEHKPISSGG